MNVSDERALWSPAKEDLRSRPFRDLKKLIPSETPSDTYGDVHHWSVTHPGEFWSAVWNEQGIIGEQGAITFDARSDFISSQFFPHGSLNVTENLFRNGRANAVAIVALDEDGTRREVTWQELAEQVAAVASALKSVGVERGDRIVAWVPNTLEPIIFALAGLSIGAVISTSSPDFAAGAVIDRFGQIEPKVLLVAGHYLYGGKRFECGDRVTAIVAGLPTLTTILTLGPTSEIAQNFAEWSAPHQGKTQTFERFPFDHPGFVLFSSGTTGKPKCITHSAAGVMLKVGEEQHFQFGLTNLDRVFYFSTCGWMMWNWLLMALGTGATIVVFDGSPTYPHAGRLFEIAAEERLTFLGLSAKLLDVARKESTNPSQEYDLLHLDYIASTGSVLSPEGFDFVYERVKSDVRLVSMTGGTDICGCFVAAVPDASIYRGELQGPCLGMATDVFGTDGFPAGVDEKGELVCTVPFPSKPLGFWGDSDNAKYRASYFEGFPGVWTHGDFAAKTVHGGFILFGRSDATLNSRGVRIGTAEIYRVVESFDDILESMAVSQDWEDDTRVVLFVVLKDGFTLTDDLIGEIKLRLRTQASPRHVPDLFLSAPELPRTKSNKLVELAVTDIVNGRVVRNVDALANPDSLEWFRTLLWK